MVFYPKNIKLWEIECVKFVQDLCKPLYIIEKTVKCRICNLEQSYSNQTTIGLSNLKIHNCEQRLLSTRTVKQREKDLPRLLSKQTAAVLIVFALVQDEDKERRFIITAPGCGILLLERAEEHIICFPNNAMQMYGRNVGTNYGRMGLHQHDRLQNPILKVLLVPSSISPIIREESRGRRMEQEHKRDIFQGLQEAFEEYFLGGGGGA